VWYYIIFNTWTLVNHNHRGLIHTLSCLVGNLLLLKIVSLFLSLINMEDGEIRMDITIIVMGNLIFSLKMLKFCLIMIVGKMIISPLMIMISMSLKETMEKKSMIHHLSVHGKWEIYKKHIRILKHYLFILQHNQ